MSEELYLLVISLAQKIDALTSEVRRLSDAVIGGGAALSPQPDLPEELISFPPAESAVTIPGESEESRTLAMDEILQSEIPRPQHKTHAEVFEAMFKAALDPDERRGFLSYLGCVHSDILTGRLAMVEQREFNWKKLRRNVSGYLVNDDPTTVHIVRTVPADPNDGSSKIKFFVHSETRSPAPVILQRDPANAQSWRIYFSSL